MKNFLSLVVAFVKIYAAAAIAYAVIAGICQAVYMIATGKWSIKKAFNKVKESITATKEKAGF